MKEELFFRGVFSGVLALTFAWVVFSRQDENDSVVSEFEGQKYRPYIFGALLPLFFVSITIMGACFFGISGAVRLTLSSFFGIFLSICLYYPILLLLLPILRKHISARACAMLWLLPNYLYILVQSHMQLPSPLLVIPLKGNWAGVLFGIWFLGFAAVLLGKCREHLRFREQLLADARPVTDPKTLAIWSELLADANFKKPKFQLVLSPAAATPMTIGTKKVISPNTTPRRRLRRRWYISISRPARNIR